MCLFHMDKESLEHDVMSKGVLWRAFCGKTDFGQISCQVLADIPDFREFDGKYF